MAIRHFRALPHAEVAAATATVRGSRALPALKLAFEFPGADGRARGRGPRGAVGRDGPDHHVWTVPASRMKAKREHRVQLCGRAVGILDAARTLGGGDSPLVFPGPRGKPLSHTPLYTVQGTRDRRRPARLPTQLPGLTISMASASGFPKVGIHATSNSSINSLARLGRATRLDLGFAHSFR